MAHPNEAVVRTAYAAFSAGDLEVLGQLISPDMVHSVPGNDLMSGEHTGRDAAFAVYGQLFALTGGTSTAR